MPRVLYLEIREIALFLQEQGFFIRDIGLLESALMRPKASVFGGDAYPHLSRKTAALFSSIIRNHPMVDGNKRSAFVVALIFLNANGFDLSVSEDEAYDFIVATAAKQEDLDEIEAFFVNHMVEL